ncbi:MAG: putative LPS assembly protein LptD [Acidobacteriota bacterium]
MFRFTFILTVCLVSEWFGAPAAARAQGSLAGCHAYQQQNLTARRLAGDHYVLDGTNDAPVQIDCDDMQLFADHVESFQVEGRLLATGNVVYVSAGHRIRAERLEFNTKTKTGTFFVAYGTTTLTGAENPSLFGSQEPDAYFWGDELQKIGPKKYRIIRGGFTTCVQPTPRWDMRGDSITLNLGDYVLLKNMIFSVKHVPMFYLPAFYYPINDENRSTGFLMPIYGSTTARGQSFTNQFFWAINRSQDATIEHDWFSKTGQGIGGEYRYVLAPGSQGNSHVSYLKEKSVLYSQPDGSQASYPAQQSFNITGDLTQRLPAGLYARANTNYYSSIVANQRYQQDPYQATNRTRRINANLTGNWAGYSLSATADKNDVFQGATSFQTYGSLPRVTFSRAERPFAGAHLYFGTNTEFVTLSRSTTTDGVKSSDQGLSRVDVNPTLRIPFTRWPFLTVNSSVAWRGTYWTESLDASNAQVPIGIGRKFFDFSTRITGPVFNRIWNTPNKSYAQKFKHVVEPTLTIQRVTAIDNFKQIVALEGTDFIVGSVTRYNYALANRLYAKKAVSREIVSATISQSYYTDANAAQYDSQNQGGFGHGAPTHFGAVLLQARGAPTDRIQVDFRTEWDPTAHTIRTLATNGSILSGSWLQATAGWSQRRFIPNLPPFNDPASATNFLNAVANIRTPGGHLGGDYSFQYDLRRDSFLQQRISLSYNAQCCGVGIEYQTFDLRGAVGGIGLLQDHRFNLSFTLAGVGTFSNLFGAFGGQNR